MVLPRTIGPGLEGDLDGAGRGGSLPNLAIWICHYGSKAEYRVLHPLVLDNRLLYRLNHTLSTARQTLRPTLDN